MRTNCLLALVIVFPGDSCDGGRPKLAHACMHNARMLLMGFEESERTAKTPIHFAMYMYKDYAFAFTTAGK